MRRRELLQRACYSSVAGGLLLSTTWSASDEQAFGVSDVDVDVSDGDEISGRIADVNSGERLFFPAGEFTWSRPVSVTADGWGISCHPETVFTVPDGFGVGESERLLQTGGGSVTSSNNFLLENLTFDSDGRSAPELRLFTRNDAVVRNLHFAMNGPQTNEEHANALTPHVEESDGEFVLENVVQYNNGDLGGYARGSSRVGVFVGPNNDGTVRLVNPVLQGFPNNACYVSRQPGTVIVEGGLLLNNNVSAVRVSGGVEVYDTTVVIDTDSYRDGPGVIKGTAHNTRGFWGDNRQAGRDGGVVKDVSVVLESYDRSSGLVCLLENPQVTVEGSQFLANASIDCIQADNGEIVVTNCSFDGSANNVTAGTENVTGFGNDLNPGIEPGQVTVASTDNYAFDWSRTHPETPDRIHHLRTAASTFAVSVEDGVGPMDYVVTTTGQPLDIDGTAPGRSVVHDQRGTWTITGTVDEGGRDRFKFVGSVRDWMAEFNASKYAALVNDTELVSCDGTTEHPAELSDLAEFWMHDCQTDNRIARLWMHLQ